MNFIPKHSRVTFFGVLRTGLRVCSNALLALVRVGLSLVLEVLAADVEAFRGLSLLDCSLAGLSPMADSDK